MAAIQFDIVSLCKLVEERECLWNKRCESHKNKFLHDKAWEEIFQVFGRPIRRKKQPFK